MLRNQLRKQKDSRQRLRDAVEEYMTLRAADGVYTDQVRTTDRMGRKVVVLITLDILSDEH